MFALSRIAITLILVLTSVGLGPTEALAAGAKAEDADMPIRVIQRRPILRAGRIEVSAKGGGGLADTMFNHAVVSGDIRYHLNETTSVGAGYGHHFGQTSALFDEVTDRFELFPERSVIEWTSGVDVGWTPIYGKFAVVDSYIIHFDMTLLAGAAAVRTSRSPDPKIAAVTGLGMKLYLGPWLALTADVKNHAFTETFNAGDTLVNHMVAQGGFSVFFPFEYAYRYPR